MEFNNMFGFINNEEDFINFVNLYKKIRNSRTSYGFNLAGLNYNDDTLFYKKSILNTSRYIDILLKDEIIKRDIKCIYIPYRRLSIEETLIIDKSNLAIDSMIEKYNNKMINKIKNGFYVDLQLYVYGNIKNVLVNIDEEIYNFIKDEKCLRLYLFFKYYTSRLNNDISSIEVPLFHIMQITDIYDNEIRDCINILLNNGLLRRIESETSMPRYELYNNINDNFIYDTSDKNNYVKKNKEKKDKHYNYYIVYEITDLTNGMKYIGKHKTTNINDGYMGSGRLLKQNQEIKGIENFEKKILHLCKNDKHMAEMEAMEIEKVKAYENNMYYNLKKEK